MYVEFEVPVENKRFSVYSSIKSHGIPENKQNKNPGSRQILAKLANRW